MMDSEVRGLFVLRWFVEPSTAREKCHAPPYFVEVFRDRLLAVVELIEPLRVAIDATFQHEPDRNRRERACAGAVLERDAEVFAARCLNEGKKSERAEPSGDSLREDSDRVNHWRTSCVVIHKSRPNSYSRQ